MIALPDDFNRKLKEWERLKHDQAGSGNSRQHRDPSPPNVSLDHAREVARNEIHIRMKKQIFRHKNRKLLWCLLLRDW